MTISFNRLTDPPTSYIHSTIVFDHNDIDERIYIKSVYKRKTNVYTNPQNIHDKAIQKSCEKSATKLFELCENIPIDPIFVITVRTFGGKLVNSVKKLS